MKWASYLGQPLFLIIDLLLFLQDDYMDACTEVGGREAQDAIADV